MAAQDDSIVCPVCQETYNDPRFLLCGHSFCLKCIQGIAGNEHKFPCPICRFCVDLRNGAIDQLPKNYVLSNVIDAKDMNKPSICANHKKLLDIFCESCNVIICSKCLVLQHKSHAIEDIDKIFTERNEKLSAFLGITKLWTSAIQKKRDVVEQSRNCMESSADSINKAVHKVFKKWHDDLQTQQNTILIHLQQEIEKRMQGYDEAESVLKSYMAYVTGLETEISDVRSKGTAFVVQQYDSIKASQDDTRRKIQLEIDTCYTPPNDLIMKILAPWIEEAIGNIQLIDMTHEEVRPRPQKIAEIQSENVVLKRDIERFKDENVHLQALLSRLHQYVTAGTEANYSTLELPSEIQSDSSVASNYKAAQDIWKKFMEIKGNKPVNDSMKTRNNLSTRGEIKQADNGASDKSSWSLYACKAKDTPIPSDRINYSQVGYSTQWDSSSRKIPDNDQIETQSNLSQECMAQSQRCTKNATQFDIHDQDVEKFKHFCHLYPRNDEQTIKTWFGGDFDRFYHLYIVQEFGNHSSA